MNKTRLQKTEEYHLVLQRFINLILFGKLRNPNFSKNISEIEIQNKLLDFFQSLNGKFEEERNNIINTYYDELLLEFRKKMRNNDAINLITSYDLSNFRVITNIFKMLNGTQTKLDNDTKKKESEIINGLIWGKILPEEIKAYLFMQFFDIFKFVPQNSNTISKEQYMYLIDRYVGEYDYNKVINIVYQKFEEID